MKNNVKTMLLFGAAMPIAAITGFGIGYGAAKVVNVVINKIFY